MTKKDYIIISKVLNDIVSGGALCMDNEDDTRDMVRQFADALQADNARFARARFAQACGVDDLEKQREE